ncbi:hypothetical protein Nepgr_008886 [Nepenthes gracilis]|uniref:BZIP domain-containing protein n=1 Tax=Nepenthes gracilis TaxID=150966 RepID=A0AAD3S9T6_NEPGR|nr:hypothetical protein Nepgr_008886 [Nepenthes gracilis]
MKDPWLRAAMTDDGVVVQLLLRLKQSDSYLLRPTKPASSFPPLGWGVRQPRTKAAASEALKKEREPTRLSPKTPLSWSACGSGSGGGGGSGTLPSDGCEESSRPSGRFPCVRSKEPNTNATTTTTKKRPRRKKTFAELKAEESSLLKEQSYLKRELVMLHATLKEQISVNGNLKRMKIDLHVESETESDATLSETAAQNTSKPCPVEESTLEGTPNLPQNGTHDNVSVLELCPAAHKDGNPMIQEQPVFALPDLNMNPEEGFVPETLV